VFLENSIVELLTRSLCKTFLIQKIIVPIIIFGDGSVIDGALQNTLKPFSFTLGIFHLHTCAKLSAWRNLGYI